MNSEKYFTEFLKRGLKLAVRGCLTLLKLEHFGYFGRSQLTKFLANVALSYKYTVCKIFAPIFPTWLNLISSVLIGSI
jgi:hypothetical protein